MDLPLVSVIMPVRNEADFLAESLGAVLAQDYLPERMEVLIADGMSTDRTRGIVSELAARHPQRAITLLDNPGCIVATGLNAALRVAKGEIIIRIDGHCRIASDYVSRCVDHLRHDDVDGVGGSINTVAGTAVGRAIAAAMSSPFGVGGSAFRTMKGRTMLVDTVPFPAYSRHAIDMAGPFDEKLIRNQDDEYNYRLRKLGARILLSADVKSDYYSRSSLSSLWKQYFQYGYYKVRVMRKHVRQMQVRQFVPAAFVVALCGGAVGGLFSDVVLRVWQVVLVLYGAATLVASLAIARQSPRMRPWALLVVFPILHISYGLGFLVGVTRFAARRDNPRVSPTVARDAGFDRQPQQ